MHEYEDAGKYQTIFVFLTGLLAQNLYQILFTTELIFSVTNHLKLKISS